LIVTTRKIAELVSGAETTCETAATDADACALIGSDANELLPARLEGIVSCEVPSVKSIKGTIRLPKVVD
jgi:hypothetical protein